MLPARGLAAVIGKREAEPETAAAMAMAARRRGNARELWWLVIFADFFLFFPFDWIMELDTASSGTWAILEQRWAKSFGPF